MITDIKRTGLYRRKCDKCGEDYGPTAAECMTTAGGPSVIRVTIDGKDLFVCDECYKVVMNHNEVDKLFKLLMGMAKES